MIFCKFDKPISIFPYEESVGHRLIVAPALKRANQYSSHVGLCADKHIILKMLVVEIYSRLHGSEKKFQQYDDYGM